MDELSVQEIEDLKRAKKRFLKRYRKLNERVNRLIRKLALLDDRIKAIKSPTFSGMPRGGVPITIDDLMSDKLDLEDRIKRLKQKGRDLKREICEEIDSLEDPRFCDVLEMFCIDCMEFVDIGEELGYTERHVIALYSEAIEILSLRDQ